MLLTIPALLNPAQIDKLTQLLQQGDFVDGKLSAGRAASPVKQNEELAQSPELLQRLYRIIMPALGHHADFRRATLPRQVADFIFARYQPGMRYGDHVDDPIMGGGKFRSDISMTLFLSDPNDYEGGELVIHTHFGEQTIKLDAGSAVIYPSSSLHRVAEVTRGERLVALTWIQSFVRDPQKRALLYDLDQVRETLLQQQPDIEHTKRLDRSYVNLLRMWSEI